MTNFTASGHQLVTRQRNGKDGRSVSKVDVVYQRSTSATSVPTTWVTTAPKLPKGYYLWSATKVTYKEADGKTTTEVIGAQCIASADNLKTTVERYAQTTSRTTPPDNSSGAWQEGDTSGVQAKDGYYTWTQTKIVWQDGTITYTTPICITGDKGNTGKNGTDGKDGKDGTDGADGNGIASRKAYFAVTDKPNLKSHSDIAATAWSADFPELSEVSDQKPYVWKSVLTTYTQLNGEYWSTPELVTTYHSGSNANLIDNASFVSNDRMSAWDVKDGTIMTGGKDGRNFFRGLNNKRGSEQGYQELLRQTLWEDISSGIKKLKPATWYTLSYWSRQGAQDVSIKTTSTETGFAKKNCYLYAGHTYTLHVRGYLNKGTYTDNRYLRVWVYHLDSNGNKDYQWSLDISETYGYDHTLTFTPTAEGEYYIDASLYPAKGTDGKDYGSVTVDTWRIVDNTQIGFSYLYPSAVDTAQGYFIDGVQYTDGNTDLHVQLSPNGSWDWQRHVVTFKTKSKHSILHDFEDTESVLFRMMPSPMTGQNDYLDICMPKLEEGMFATGFTDSAEDAKGISGCIQRVTEWASGIEFHNDEGLTSGTRFLDIAVVTKSASSFNAYKCLKTHVSSSRNAPQAGVTTECWQPINNMAPIYTPLIMAQNALLRLAQTNQIVVTDSNDNVTGGMQGNIAKPIFWIKDPKTQASVEIGFTSNSDGSISPYIVGHNQDIEQTNSSEHAFRIDPLNGSYEFYGKNLQRFLINDDGLTYWDAYGKEMEIDSQGGLTFYGQLARFQTARFELPEGNVYLRLTYKGNANMFGYVKGTLSKSTGQVTYDLENIAAYEIQNGKIVSVGTYDKDHWAWDS